MADGYGITDKGFNQKRLDEIYDGICASLKAEIGINPSENPQGILNIIVTIFADEIAKLWESFGTAYMQLFPLTAEGIALDNLMEIGGISRIGKSRTEYSLACTGDDGTYIPAGAIVRSNTSPSRQFRCKNISKISSDGWQSIRFRPIANISGSFTFTFEVKRNATSGEVGDYSSGNILSKDMTVSSYADAYTQILSALRGFSVLSNLGISVENVTNDDDSKDIVLTGSKASDSFNAAICSYMTIVQVTSNIIFESVEYGAVLLANDTITEIVTSIDGFDEVSNKISPSAGRLAQTDAEARSTYLERIANRGQSTIDSIVSLLYSDVAGVTFAKGYENDGDTKNSSGLPPHSISIIVQGGDDSAVANVIFSNKAAGIRAYGTYYAYATDINGDKQYVEFTRVETVYLLLSVKVTSIDNNLDVDYIARIQSLLTGQELTVGQTIRLQRFIQPILNNISGADYVEIKGKLSSDSDILNVSDIDMLSGIVPVAISQQPILAANCIRVVQSS